MFGQRFSPPLSSHFSSPVPVLWLRSLSTSYWSHVVPVYPPNLLYGAFHNPHEHS